MTWRYVFSGGSLGSGFGPCLWTRCKLSATIVCLLPSSPPWWSWFLTFHNYELHAEPFRLYVAWVRGFYHGDRKIKKTLSDGDQVVTLSPVLQTDTGRSGLCDLGLGGATMTIEPFTQKEYHESLWWEGLEVSLLTQDGRGWGHSDPLGSLLASIPGSEEPRIYGWGDQMLRVQEEAQGRKLGAVVHTRGPNIWETEARGSWIWDWSELQPRSYLKRDKSCWGRDTSPRWLPTQLAQVSSVHSSFHLPLIH